MHHQPQNPAASYSLQDNPAVVTAIAARTAAHFARFLLPHLQPGMRLLDCGCGPGSITVGLAAAVAPGEVVGVDVDAGSINRARQLATEQCIANVRFEVANLYELPFPDRSFDVVFSHAVLLHIQDPIGALREMRRVLKTGGLVGIRNDDLDGALTAPPDPLLLQTWTLMGELLRRNGGDSRGAKHSRYWLREAGFTRIEASAAYECYGTPQATAWCSAAYIPILRNLQPRFAELGLADEETVERICAAWQTWGAHPVPFSPRRGAKRLGGLTSYRLLLRFPTSPAWSQDICNSNR